MRRLHILTQYVWPDDAPTGIYAEQVADGLVERGARVELVSGSGAYRPGSRRPPVTPVRRLHHFEGKRGKLLSTALEYASVHRAFSRYIRREVDAGDVVLITSAPPTTVFLHRVVLARGAVGIYWLQDFYPQLIRGVWDPPEVVVAGLARAWRRALASWPRVVKSAANLGYFGDNTCVFRNWNTLEPGPSRPARPKTALYSGNLGYGHDVEAFLDLCRTLHEEGFEITVRGDGPGIARMPQWIHTSPPFRSPDDLVASYWSAEVHLVAADPELTDAIFPSKLWNSLVVGRPVRASGFAGAMAEELSISLASDPRRHLPALVEYLAEILEVPELAGP